MLLAADQFPACQATFWSRVDGWEVVAAVFFIITAWAAVQMGRQYFAWRLAATNTCCCGGKTD